MGHADDLHLGEMGLYKWGSLLIRFAAIAPVERRNMGMILASISQHVGKWKTPGEFRGIVALTHEIVHYFQDLTTGLGHHDELTRRRSHRCALIESRMRSWSVDPATARATAVATCEKADGPLGDQLILPLAGERARAFCEQASAIPDIAFSKEGVTDFNVISLLEVEAALTVYAHVMSTQTDLLGRTLLDEHQSMWNPGVLPDPYRVPIATLLGLVLGIYGIERTDKGVKTGLNFLGVVIGCLIDLACAYPAQQTITRAGMPDKEFEPGLKLIRALLALHTADASENERFCDAIRALDYRAAETVILKHCAVKYPTCKEIYTDWEQEFEVMLKQDDDPVLRIRRDACRARIDDGSRFVDKGLLQIILSPIPLLWDKDGETQIVFSNQFAANPEQLSELLAELDVRRTDKAFIAYIGDAIPFVCPIRSKCAATTEVCGAGIRQNSDFPPIPGCGVRSRFEGGGWSLITMS
jgi:hypothetical protein